MLTVDYGRGGGQFDNFNFNFIPILADGLETVRYQTIFRLATAYELLILEFVYNVSTQVSYDN